MLRFLFALLIVVTYGHSDLLIGEATACKSGQVECKPCLRPGSEPEKEIYNKAPDVTLIDLDRKELHLKRREDADKPQVYDIDLVTIVTVTAEDPEKDKLTYNYTISGGRIVGTGQKVQWDLNGVQPGTYTLTSGVDDGCGICGETMTVTLNVVQD